MIELTYGGEFDEKELVDVIRRSGRDSIIQGQIAATRRNHPKPHSLDYWLRQFAKDPNTKQANEKVIDALVATRLFVRVSKLECPNSGRLCNGIQLSKKDKKRKPNEL